MPALVLGPLLRYVGEHDATIWVETDAPCEVEVRGCRTRTFQAGAHHYALLQVDGLEARGTYPYEVALDGETVWPERDSEFPTPVIRTLRRGEPLRVAFGSCRVALPHEAPYTRPKDQDERGREIDALWALTQRMRKLDPEDWPHLLLWVGDQIYADEVSPGTEDFIAKRRGTGTPPHEQVADFEEYTHLYLDSWSEPVLRWLLSVVPSAMIFDDHDVHDDWNTSQAWVREYREKPWWEARITGGLATYWIYQHLGNLSPTQLEGHDLYRRVREADGDVLDMLLEFAHRADRETDGSRWSYHRDLGDTRLVVMDSRAGRVLTPGGRTMLDEADWDWLTEHATGGFDHLLLGTSLPVVLSGGTHGLEAWNEAVCDGAWGKPAAKLGERIRQGLDLEHWAAFHRSFRELLELIAKVGRGERGRAPASITILSGDVHHAYLAQLDLPGAGVRSAVHQAVCSPFRNPLDARERRVIRASWTRPLTALTRRLARAAGVREPPVRWRRVGGGPWFDNQVGCVEIDGREATVRIERATPEGDDAELETVLEAKLT